MKTLLSLFFLLIASDLFAQTHIKNEQEVFGYWKKDGSPYIVEGQVIIPKGKMLIIETGVTVQFKSGTDFEMYKKDGTKNDKFDAGYMLVYGILVARGSNLEKVLLTSDSETGQWGGIIFKSSNQNEVQNCIVEKTHYIRRFTTELSSSGSLTFIKSDGVVQNSIIKQSWASVNAQWNSHVKIKNCVLTENEYGLDVNTNSRVVAINTILWNNKNSFFLNPNVSMIVESCLLQDMPNNVVDRGNNIVNKDPMLNSDYSISSESICYKSGKYRRNIGLDFWL